MLEDSTYRLCQIVTCNVNMGLNLVWLKVRVATLTVRATLLNPICGLPKQDPSTHSGTQRTRHGQAQRRHRSRKKEEPLAMRVHSGADEGRTFHCHVASVWYLPEPAVVVGKTRNRTELEVPPLSRNRASYGKSRCGQRAALFAHSIST